MEFIPILSATCHRVPGYGIIKYLIPASETRASSIPEGRSNEEGETIYDHFTRPIDYNELNFASFFQTTPLALIIFSFNLNSEERK